MGSSRQARLVLGSFSLLVDPGIEGPGRAGGPGETVTQEAGDLKCEAYAGLEAGGVPYRMMPPLVTRGPEVSPAYAPPGALGGAMGSSKERLRPPFNSAAGAGLAGPPGPRGLPGSVPALPAAREAARPGHSPSPDSGRSRETPSLSPAHDHQASILPRTRSPHFRLADFLSLHSTVSTPALAQHPCSRPRGTLSSHPPASRTAPSRGAASLQPLLFAALERDAGSGSLRDGAITHARRRRRRRHRIHRTPTNTATHTHLTQHMQHSHETDTQHIQPARARAQTPSHTTSTYAAHPVRTELTHTHTPTPTINTHVPVYRGKHTTARCHPSTSLLQFSPQDLATLRGARNLGARPSLNGGR